MVPSCAYPLIMSMSFSTEEVLLQCMLGSLNDSNRNPYCDCLLSGGGPPLNTDIGGIGVRISFYLQSLFLALLSARSKSFNETSGALYTLVTTNIAMVVTSFILGFKSSPEISFHEYVGILLFLLVQCISSKLQHYQRNHCLLPAKPLLGFHCLLDSVL